MKYEERKKQLCRECDKKEECPYFSRGLEHKCEYICNVMYGWELGYKDASDVARNFLTRDLDKALEEGFE